MPDLTATHPTPSPAMTILPTIHLNGTGADALRHEYRALRKATAAAIDALVEATCNARDFYPQAQGVDAYYRAREERDAMLANLIQVRDYAQAWETRAAVSALQQEQADA